MKTRSFRRKSQAREAGQSRHGDQCRGNATVFSEHHVVGSARGRGRHHVREEPARFEMPLSLFRQPRKDITGTDQQEVESSRLAGQHGKRRRCDTVYRSDGPRVKTSRGNDNRTIETLSLEAKTAVAIGIDGRLPRKARLHARWATAHALAPALPSGTFPELLPDQSRETPTARMMGAAINTDE